MTSKFASAAELMAKVLGIPDYKFAIIDHPVSSASDAQLELGDIYWNEIARQAIMIGLILFIFRIAISVTLYINNGTRRIRAIDIYIALLITELPSVTTLLK